MSALLLDRLREDGIQMDGIGRLFLLLLSHRHYLVLRPRWQCSGLFIVTTVAPEARGWSFD